MILDTIPVLLTWNLTQMNILNPVNSSQRSARHRRLLNQNLGSARFEPKSKRYGHYNIRL